jgi:hypothetical protein
VITQFIREQDDFELSYTLPEFATERHHIKEKGCEVLLGRCILILFGLFFLIEEYFTVKPSELGNGIFMACLKRQGEGSSEEESMSEEEKKASLSPSHPELREKKSKSKKKPRIKKKKTHSMSSTLSSHPTLFSNSSNQLNTSIKGQKQSESMSRIAPRDRRGSFPKESNESLQSQSSRTSLKQASTISLSKQSNEEIIDLEVYGTGLKRFYAPKYDAIRRASKCQWIYPVCVLCL